MANKSLLHSSLTDNIFYRSMLAGNETYRPSTGYWIYTWATRPTIGSYYWQYNQKRPQMVYGDNATSDAHQVVNWDSNSGEIVSQFYIEGVSPDTRVTALNARGTNNYDYIAVNDESTGNSDVVVLQFDAQSSTPNWQQRFGVSPNYKLNGNGVDSSENYYFLARTENPENSVFTKLNSSGVVQWQKLVQEDYGRSMHTNASGQSLTRYLNNDFIMFDANGNIDFQTGGVVYIQNGAVASNFGNAHHFVDSSGNSYTYGYALSNNDYGALIKFNASGAVIWQKSLYIAGGATTGRALGEASDGSLLILIQDGAVPVIVSIDTADGSINWQREMTYSEAGIAIDGSSVTGDVVPDKGGLLFDFRARLIGGSYEYKSVIFYPDDGSAIGSFDNGIGVYNFAVSTRVTLANLSNNFSTLSNSTSNVNYSLGSTSMTIGATTYSGTPTVI